MLDDAMDTGYSPFIDIKAGDILLIDNSIKEVVHGDIAAVLEDNEIIIRKVNRKYTGAITLIANNPQYKTISSSDKPCQPIIMGKVIQNLSKKIQ